MRMAAVGQAARQHPQATQLVTPGAFDFKKGNPLFQPMLDASRSMERAGQINVQMVHFLHFAASKFKRAVLISLSES
jgi:hypothetical protein